MAGYSNHAAYRLSWVMVMANSVMGVVKMGNIVPRAGIASTSLAFLASVLTITSPRLPRPTHSFTLACICIYTIHVGILGKMRYLHLQGKLK